MVALIIVSLVLNQTMDTRLVHCVVYLFTPQLSLVLIVPTRVGMARLSWSRWFGYIPRWLTHLFVLTGPSIDKLHWSRLHVIHYTESRSVACCCIAIGGNVLVIVWLLRTNRSMLHWSHKLHVRTPLWVVIFFRILNFF